MGLDFGRVVLEDDFLVMMARGNGVLEEDEVGEWIRRRSEGSLEEGAGEESGGGSGENEEDESEDSE
jgi:hypothetical protein